MPRELPGRTHDQTRTMRTTMVAEQLAARDIRSKPVLDAFRTVPRERFVPPDLRTQAYEDRPLPIGSGQTISQPYIVALMVEALDLAGGEKVLEIGTGSGYAAAILAEIAGCVFSIERIGELAAFARENLAATGYADRVKIRHGDGSDGWPEEAPFDAILVSAGAPEAPAPLIAQLADGGVLVAPVGRHPTLQKLLRIRRTSEHETSQETLTDVRFVPLYGHHGWHEP